MYQKLNTETHVDSIIKVENTLAYLFFTVNIDSSLFHVEKSIQLCKQSFNEETKANVYFLYGTMLSEIGKYNESLEQLKKAEKIFLTKKNYLILGSIYNNLGRVYDVLGSYNAATECFYKAVMYYEKAGNKKAAANSKANSISAYIMIKEYDKAEKMCNQLMPEIVALNDSNLLGKINENLAAIYIFSDTTKALVHYNKALNFRLATKRMEAVVFLKFSIGSIYLSRFKATKSETYYNLAKKEFEEAIKICGDYKVGMYFPACYKVLSDLFMSKNYADSSLYYARLSAVKAIELGVTGDLSSAYNNMYLAFEKKKQLDSAIFYIKKSFLIQDTMSNNQIKKKMLNSEMDYVIQKNEALNKLQIAEKERDITVRNSLIITLSSLVLIILLVIAYFNIKRQKEKQKEFSVILIQSQEEERKRISKELHDGIGQNLLMIKTACSANTPLIEATIDELRSISRNLHPVQLEKLGFSKAIESIVSDAESMSSIFFSCEIENIDDILNDNQKINLYRVIQECVSNIIKHSNAADARVTVNKESKKIITTVYDNGTGFDLSLMKRKKSLGLTSIAERVNLINGSLTIISGKQGTKTEIKIDYA